MGVGSKLARGMTPRPRQSRPSKRSLSKWADCSCRRDSDLAPRPRHTFAEYLELEEISAVRHEFYAGEIYAMAGGTPEHAAMAAAIATLFGRQLEGGACRVYSSDLRVRVLATGLATYPDVTVICGKSERDPDSPTHVTNPKVVVEVLSPGTEDYDRGEKLQHYQTGAEPRSNRARRPPAPAHRTVDAPGGGLGQGRVRRRATGCDRRYRM